MGLFLQLMPHVQEFLKNSNKGVFTPKDIENLIQYLEYEYDFPITQSGNLLSFLNKRQVLQPVEKVNGIKGKLYAVPGFNILELVQRLKPNAHLSHLSALQLHGLVSVEAKRIYITTELSKKQSREITPLTQEQVDKAFVQPQRKQAPAFTWKSYIVYHLNGKFTNQLGIERLNACRVTNLERTLIDSIVRPDYAGGPFTILEAFKKAKARLDIPKLIDMVNRLAFIYPYHQALGFYLEKAGYDVNKLTLLKAKHYMLNFYLAYDMENMSYDTNWKIYYPNELLNSKE